GGDPMIGRLWKWRTVHELTAALVAFVLYDLLKHDDTNAWPADDSATLTSDSDATDWAVLANRGVDGLRMPDPFNDYNDAVVTMDDVQCPAWHVTDFQYELA